MQYVKTAVVTHEDGSHTIHAGDVTFGPYGPGPCPETYPATGDPCAHTRGHVGCCATADGDDKIPKHRWFPTNREA